jgi:hypothetical protein
MTQAAMGPREALRMVEWNWVRAEGKVRRAAVNGGWRPSYASRETGGRCLTRGSRAS